MFHCRLGTENLNEDISVSTIITNVNEMKKEKQTETQEDEIPEDISVHTNVLEDAEKIDKLSDDICTEIESPRSNKTMTPLEKVRLWLPIQE